MLSKNHNQYKPGIVINKLLAALTVIITVICVILIFRSSINPLDMESILKSDVLPSSSEKVEASEKTKDLDEGIENIWEKQSYINKVRIINLKATETISGGLGVSGIIRNLGNRTLIKVEITIYFLDKDGWPIFEETYSPVWVSEYSFGTSNKPLNPDYSRRFGYSIDDVPSDWAKKVKAKITDIRFER
ncbi:MAG: DUF2393 family protein [Candidatus Aminicenantes bacterium]|nr:DUF2393 family protein [Candidatus Aminicenantes bacterium]